MRSIFILALGVLSMALLAACDDEPDPTCDSVDDPCETEGELRCSGDSTAIEECQEDDDGCLAWAESELCDGDTCDDSGDAPVCDDSCTDECEPEGAGECDGDVIRTCETGDDGCLAWADTEDCGEAGQTCDPSGTEPVCSGACTDSCAAEGDTQCDGTVIQTCGESAAGCLIWSDGDDCADDDQFCDDTSGAAACVDECVDQCPAAGDSQCADDVVETCETGASGCLDWVAGTDCAALDQFCSVTTGEAACTDTCVDGCDTEGDSRCTGDVIETCTADAHDCLGWVAGTDCADTDEVCDDAGADAVCISECTDNCTTTGDTRCAGAVIETCGTSAAGCLEWLAGTDCSDTDQTCDDASGDAECVTGCVDECDTVGATECVGTVISTCTAGGDGCFDLVAGDDCASHDPAQDCDDSSGDAACVAAAPGGCADPIVMTGEHFTLAGSDFTTDFSDHVAPGGTDCYSYYTAGDRIDVVIAADLLAGQSIRLTELGGLDAILSLQETCGDAEACVWSEDFGETTGYDYTAAADTRVYFIVEAYSLTPYSVDYDIHLDILAPEVCDNIFDDDGDGDTDCADTECAGVGTCEATEVSCGDDFDNDGDGDVDCDDPDCYGAVGFCETELNCGDGQDNDDDTFFDCDDTDCDASPACEGYVGIYELDPSGGHVDVQGYALYFTPDAMAEMGYTWAVAPGVASFPTTPGTGTPTATLTLTDDSTAQHVLTTMGTVPFYGVSYPSFWVSSNGYVTFDASYSDYTPSEADFFDHPMIAALWTDLNPAGTSPGTVTVDEFADQVVVTYNVVRFSTTEYQQVQLVIKGDGSIELHYVAATSSTSRDTMIGISSGTGTVPYPPETDFIPPAPEDCGDALDNDYDGLTDCDDDECFGDVDCAAAELNCEDGGDNDGDSFIDCADSDCAADPMCETPEATCDDEFDNDGDGAIDCDDSDCAPLAACQPYRGYWEQFDIDPEAFDLEGHAVIFTPDVASDMGYTWATVAGTGAYPITPGSGTPSTALTLGDDANVMHTLAATAMGSFEFYGVDYTSMYVGSNGHVTFNSGQSYALYDETDLWDRPTIALLSEDLDPRAAGASVVVDEFVDAVAVTYNNVPCYAETELNQIQVILNADGSIEFHYIAVPAGGFTSSDSFFIGIADGLAAGYYPAETNFLP